MLYGVLIYIGATLAASGSAASVPMNYLLGSDYYCNSGAACCTNKFGSNDDVDTAAAELITLTGEDHVLRFDNTTFSVASTDADDTAAGAGLQSLSVSCFTEDFELIEESITLNGQAEVAMTAPCMLPVRMRATSAGTAGASNQGTIWIGTGTFTAGVPANKYGQIAANRGQTEIAIYAVPAGRFGCMTNFIASSDDVGEVYVYRYVASENFARRIVAHFWLAPGPVPLDLSGKPLCGFKEKTIITVEGRSFSGGANVMSASFDLVTFDVAADGRVVTPLY